MKTLTKSTLLATATLAMIVAPAAQARRGADDAPGDVRQCRGCDDPAGHVRQEDRRADRQADRRADRREDRQADRRTDRREDSTPR